MMNDLTVLILTKNEELNIEKCIRSCSNVAKRLVIVDSFSDDNTEKICKRLAEEFREKNITIDFYEHEWTDYSTQFNWGLNNTLISTKWVFRIDADEYLTPELISEINTRLKKIKSNVYGVEIKRRIIFMGRWIRFGGMYPRFFLRIFRYGYGECEKRKMDEHIVVKGNAIIRFKNDLVDENKKDLTWWINKHNGYSIREKADYLEYKTRRKAKTNEVVNMSFQAKMIRLLKEGCYYRLPLLMRAKMYYLIRYYFMLGFLDGTQGKIYHFLQAYWYRFIVDAKVFEDSIENQ
ncbi:glycosyltransferase family 2 protein [Butyrivibrio sp. JL13D10]|uniref:glycosyltransferase family 2 protein n=1 Tax=Butyrivibrio sp. JL13D10 TaxID=3236815 RepID=UPI0038B6880F